MNLLSAIQSLLLLMTPAQTSEVEAKQVDFRVQVYPYGGYYSYPPYCPPGYYYGPGYGSRRRGFSFYFGPGYGPGCYYYGRPYYYRRYYFDRQYRYQRRHRGRRR